MTTTQTYTPAEQAVLWRIEREYLDPVTASRDPRTYISPMYLTANGRRLTDRSIMKAIASLAMRGAVEAKHEDRCRDGRGYYDTYLVRPVMNEEAREFAGKACAAIERQRMLDRWNIDPDYEEIESGIRRALRLACEKLPETEAALQEAVDSGDVSMAASHARTLITLLGAVEDAYPDSEMWDAEQQRQMTRHLSEITPGDMIPAEFDLHLSHHPDWGTYTEIGHSVISSY